MQPQRQCEILDMNQELWTDAAINRDQSAIRAFITGLREWTAEKKGTWSGIIPAVLGDTKGSSGLEKAQSAEKAESSKWGYSGNIWEKW